MKTSKKIVGLFLSLVLLIPFQSTQAFGPVGSLKFTSYNVNNLYRASIDPKGEYAYFGNGAPQTSETKGEPVNFIKVRLSDFSYVGALELASQGVMSNAVVDSQGQYAYFLVNFTLWKIDLANFTKKASLDLTAVVSSGSPWKLEIDALGQTGYVFLKDINGSAVSKIDLTQMKILGSPISLTTYFGNSRDYAMSVALDSQGQYFYGATSKLNGTSTMYQFRSSDMKVMNQATLNFSVYEIALDPSNQVAYVVWLTNSLTGGGLKKLDLKDFSEKASLPVQGSLIYGIKILADPNNKYVYLAGDGRVDRIDLTNFTLNGHLDKGSRAAVLHPQGTYVYFGLTTKPGIVSRINLSNFIQESDLTLWTANLKKFSRAFMDPKGEFAYFGNGDDDPATVIKIRLSDFSFVKALELQPSGYMQFAVIDRLGQYAYCLVNSTLWKVSLVDFSRRESVDLQSVPNLNYPISLELDPSGRMGYLFAKDLKGKILVKIDLANMKISGTPFDLTPYLGSPNSDVNVKMDRQGQSFYILNTDPDPTKGSYLFQFRVSDMKVMRQANYSFIGSGRGLALVEPFAYVMGWTDAYKSPAVLKMDLSDLSLKGSIPLSSPVGVSLDIDPQGTFAYVSRNVLEKIDLSNFSDVGGATLGAGIAGQMSEAAINPQGTYAYFGFYSDPGVIVKVDLSGSGSGNGGGGNGGGPGGNNPGTASTIESTGFGVFKNVFKPKNAEHLDIIFNLSQASHVKLTVFNHTGHEIRILEDSDLPALENHVLWDGRNGQGNIVSSGVYILQLKTGDKTETKKVVVIK